VRDDRVSLREHFDTRWDDHIRQHEAEVAARADALTAQSALVNAAFASSEKAIEKSEAGQKERDLKANEFRGQLDDQARTFVTKDTVDRQETDFDRRVGALTEEVRALQNANSRQQGALAVARFVGFGGLLAGLSALVYAIVNGPRPPLQ
jgi:hypothetical protein